MSYDYINGLLSIHLNLRTIYNYYLPYNISISLYLLTSIILIKLEPAFNKVVSLRDNTISLRFTFHIKKNFDLYSFN